MYRSLVSLGGNNQDQEVVSRSVPIINEMGQRKLVLEPQWDTDKLNEHFQTTKLQYIHIPSSH